MGKKLQNPRVAFALGRVFRRRSLSSRIELIIAIAFLGLPVPALSFPETASAQSRVPEMPEKQNRAEENDVYASPFGLANNFGLYVVGPGGRHGELEVQADGRSTGCQIAELNCLMHPEIQSALELTDEQIRKLKPVFEQAAEVIWRARWERGSVCEAIKKASLQNIQALATKLDKEGFVQQVLLPHQFRRLLQIERRFLFNIHASLQEAMAHGHSDQFFKMLRMDREQARSFGKSLRESASEIREDNAKWDRETILPMLREMLTGEGHGEIEGLTKEVNLFSSHSVVRFAQMSPLFVFAEVEKFPSRDPSVLDDPEKLDLTFSVFEPVILINGRFVGREDFIVRERMGAHPKWRNFLISMKFHGNKWMELSDEQVETFERLLWTDPIPEEKGGGSEIRYFGDDRLELQRMKWFEARDIGENEYRRLEGEYRKLRAENDVEMGERIEAALLPFQRERLQFAIGASQLHQMGIWHLLRYEMLGSTFKLETDELARLEKQITDRRKLELEKLVRFEQEMLESLTAEQREAFIDVFGEPVPQLPTMLFAFPYD